jgi:hypothetical protein
MSKNQIIRRQAQPTQQQGYDLARLQDIRDYQSEVIEDIGLLVSEGMGFVGLLSSQAEMHAKLCPSAANQVNAIRDLGAMCIGEHIFKFSRSA